MVILNGISIPIAYKNKLESDGEGIWRMKLKHINQLLMMGVCA